MGRMYAVPFNGTVSNAGGDVDLGSFSPADDVPIRLWGFTLGQITEVGDAMEEGVRVTVRYLPATMTVGSGGAAVTAATPPADPSGAAWSMTARVNDTTVATTSGTGLIRHEIGWNERNTPYDFFYPDERFAPTVRQSGANLTGIVVRQETTVADDYTACMTFWVEEPG